MKKVYPIIVLALSIQLIFSGCSSTNSSKNQASQGATQTQSDSSKSASLQDQNNNASSNTTNDASNDTTNNGTSGSSTSNNDTSNNTIKSSSTSSKQGSTSSNSLTSLSKDDIQKYITMTKASIIKSFGTNYKSQGSTLTFSNGLTFSGLSSSQSKPSAIKCINTIKVIGIKNGMTFSQVESVFGKTNVIKTYVGTKTNTAYKIQYTYGKSLLKVISSNMDGKNSYIEICPA